MEKSRLKELAAIHRSTLLDDVIPFWTKYGPDREHGGFFTFLDRDGSLFCKDKPVWLQGRIAWVYARLYNEVEKRPEWLELSKLALDFVLKHCFDADGRMFFVVTQDGQPLRKRRYLFSETFATIALAEYARATGESWAVDRANEVYDLLLRYYRTPGLCEPKENQQTRPSKGHAMPMILLSTTQMLQQVCDRPVYKATIDDSLDQVLNHFVKPEFKALLECVGPNGEFLDTPEGRCVNPGHAIETSWFIMTEGKARGDKALIERGLQILDWSLEIGWDKEFGGITYFTDVKGAPCVQYEWDMKLWWPHTEALYATLMALDLTGDEKWGAWYEKIHKYAFEHFGDPKFGEWYGYLHRDGTVSHRLKGNLWKAPFHLSRMLINCSKLAAAMAEK